MREAITWRGFLGDGEHDFALTPPQVRELERKTGTGIGAVARRVFGSDFTSLDLTETIRLGLIGGGATPEDALTLVDDYVLGRPLNESHPVATAILEALWFGAPKTEATNGQA